MINHATKVAIVGMGPRGLTVLERIVAHERRQKSTGLDIYLFDPHDPGSGCHAPAQPEHLLVNTVSGQITQFPDETVKEAGPIMEGPSFYHWLQEQRRISQLDGSEETAQILSNGYYSRRLFGRYLQWVYHYLVRLAPSHVKLRYVKASVERAARDHDGWLLVSDEGHAYRTDYLFLTTGHTKPRSELPQAADQQAAAPTSPVVIADPYPIELKLALIRQHMTVAIEGMGLTTFDVLSELTIGRGGRFVRFPISGELEYRPSGHEPRIIAFSRSGLPLTARAVNQKGVSGQYRPRFLTLDRVREMRSHGKLDFARSILPLLLSDMEYVYYEAYFRQHHGRVAAMLFCNELVVADEAQRKVLIAKQVPPENRFNWKRLVDPVPSDVLASRTSFRTWLCLQLRQDLYEARKGNVDNPLKAASDVLRDLRDTLRAAVDFGGLTEASHRWLYSEFFPVMNRVAVGPPKERIEEMLALMEAGVLSADWGPGASCIAGHEGKAMSMVAKLWPDENAHVDVLVKARVSMHSPGDDASPLMQHLLASGYARLFYNGGFHPGGIEIDRDFNLVSKEGTTIENAWALGMPTEGAKFYTFVVPRPGVNSTAIVDAGHAVSKMVSLIQRQAPRMNAGRVKGRPL